MKTRTQTVKASRPAASAPIQRPLFRHLFKVKQQRPNRSFVLGYN